MFGLLRGLGRTCVKGPRVMGDMLSIVNHRRNNVNNCLRVSKRTFSEGPATFSVVQLPSMRFDGVGSATSLTFPTPDWNIHFLHIMSVSQQ